MLGGTIASLLVLSLAVVASGTRSASAAGATPHYGKVPATPLPADLERYVREASACPGLDPMVLVAIHDMETRRDLRGATSAAGAVGPMQFLPTTWAAYGFDANGDGASDPMNLDDALAAATRLLCRNGGANPNAVSTAVWNYNHSHAYVDAVLARTAELHALLHR